MEKAALDRAIANLNLIIDTGKSKEIPDDLESHEEFLFLREKMTELLRDALALSKGDLAKPIKTKGFMAGALRTLQADLRHLTWQAKMVATGDFSQRVDFMGEFSDAFNSMIKGLEKARSDLAESERKFRLLAEHAQDVIWTINLEGRYSFVSPSIAQLTGFTPADLMDKPLDDVLPGLSFSQLRGAFSAASTDGQGADSCRIFELKHPRKDGSMIWTEVTIGALYDDEGDQTGYIGISRDITERKKMQDELTRLATTDPLTGAVNRRAFLERGEKEVIRAIRYHHPLSLLMLDVDYFKRINDTRGHPTGDEVLRILVRTCMKCLRSGDTLGRFGGEEFTILLPETDRSDATFIAERVRSDLAAVKVQTEKGEEFSFTASIGVASEAGADFSVDKLIQQADAALYNAKHDGRNCVR